MTFPIHLQILARASASLALTTESALSPRPSTPPRLGVAAARCQEKAGETPVSCARRKETVGVLGPSSMGEMAARVSDICRVWGRCAGQRTQPAMQDVQQSGLLHLESTALKPSSPSWTAVFLGSPATTVSLISASDLLSVLCGALDKAKASQCLPIQGQAQVFPSHLGFCGLPWPQSCQALSHALEASKSTFQFL